MPIIHLSTQKQLIAILGIVVNGFAFLRIKRSNGDAHRGHAHHGHSHTQDADFNSKAIMLHLLEDVLGWVAVLIGAVVIYFTGWYWIDGVLALVIGAFIGYNATKNLISTMNVLLQSVPKNIDADQLSQEMLHTGWQLSCWLAARSAQSGGQNRSGKCAVIRLANNGKVQHPTPNGADRI